MLFNFVNVIGIFNEIIKMFIFIIFYFMYCNVMKVLKIDWNFDK